MMLLNNRARWYLLQDQPAQAIEIFEILEPRVSKLLGKDQTIRDSDPMQSWILYCLMLGVSMIELQSYLRGFVPEHARGTGIASSQSRRAILGLIESLI